MFTHITQSDDLTETNDSYHTASNNIQKGIKIIIQ